MSDLISRSKLLKEIETWGGAVESLHEYIREMPTTYDIDKVVEELETMSQYITFKDMFAVHENVKMIATDTAIEIVKHSDVFEDVCEWKQASTAKYKTSCGYKLEEYFDTNACYCKQCGKKIKVVE